MKNLINRSRSSELLSSAVAMAFLAAGTILPAQQPPPAPTPAGRTAPPRIVLKLDDLQGMHPNWQKVVDIITKRGIKASFGIICSSLEHPSPQYVQWLKTVQAGGNIEFWCHGYDHRTWTENGFTMMEFSGPPAAQQKQHLERCQELARQVLGAPFASFGAPFNATDSNFAPVIRDDPDFKVWIYGDFQYPMGKTVLIRVGDVNIEAPLFQPSVDRFIEGYRRHVVQPYFVVQGHPPEWDEAKLAQFEKILDFCTEQKAVFMTPSELAATLPPPKPPGPLPPPTKPIPAPTPPGAPPPPGISIGMNMIDNGDFATAMSGWRLECLNDTKGDAVVEEIAGGKHAIHITVPQVADKRYFVQLTEAGNFPVTAGKTYTLSFRGRAKPGGAAIVIVMPTARGPVAELGRADHIVLKEEWADYTYTLGPKQSADAVHLLISGLSAQAAEYWFTDVSLRQNE